MACLHLAERCASILSSVRAEAELAGPAVMQTLEHPLSRLAETFKAIGALLQKYGSDVWYIDLN
jgi:abelson tyrosine-protein kinase 1